MNQDHQLEAPVLEELDHDTLDEVVGGTRRAFNPPPVVCPGPPPLETM